MPVYSDTNIKTISDGHANNVLIFKFKNIIILYKIDKKCIKINKSVFKL